MLSGPRPITTLLLCKPSVVKRSLAKLLRRVIQEGFVVVAMRLVMLSEDEAVVAIPTEDSEVGGNGGGRGEAWYLIDAIKP